MFQESKRRHKVLAWATERWERGRTGNENQDDVDDASMTSPWTSLYRSKKINRIIIKQSSSIESNQSSRITLTGEHDGYARLIPSFDKNVPDMPKRFRLYVHRPSLVWPFVHRVDPHRRSVDRSITFLLFHLSLSTTSLLVLDLPITTITKLFRSVVTCRASPL